MRERQIDLDFLLGRADIAGDIQIEVVGLNLVHLDASSVPLDALLAMLVGVDDLLDMLVGQVVLSLALLEMFGRVDEQNIVGLLALLQDEDADRDAGRVEQVCRQAYDGVDVPVVNELAADLRLGIVKLADCRLFSVFPHETKPLKLRRTAVDNLPRFRSESG